MPRNIDDSHRHLIEPRHDSAAVGDSCSLALLKARSLIPHAVAVAGLAARFIFHIRRMVDNSLTTQILIFAGLQHLP